MAKLKKFSLLILSGILILVSGLFMSFGMIYKNERKLHYSEHGDADYKVYLKPNHYFTEEYLGKGRKYIANLIDHIDVNYHYDFKGNKPMNYTCKYGITAYSKVTDNANDKKIIYDNSKCLMEEKTVNFENSSNVEINQPISINYDEYSSTIRDFIEDYKLSTSNSTLSLILSISLEGKSEGFENLILDKSFITLNIPLKNEAIEMEISNQEIDNEGDKTEVSSNKIINWLCYILSVLFLLPALYFMYVFISNFIKNIKQLSYYEEMKKKILYRYNRVISEVLEVPIFNNCIVIDMKDFDDLVNARDCTEKPILFKEINKDSEGLFLVADREIVYRYVLKNKEKS